MGLDVSIAVRLDIDYQSARKLGKRLFVGNEEGEKETFLCLMNQPLILMLLIRSL